MEITEQNIENLINKYREELRYLDIIRSLRWGNTRWKNILGQYDDFEGILLYCIIREYVPKRVLDIGCGCGYTTLHILSALKKNQQGKCISYDISDIVTPIAKDIIKSMNLEEYSDVITKDVFKEDLKSIGKYDISFIDLDGHTYDDGKWWTVNIVPLLDKKNILVHDIVNLGDGPERYDEWRPIKEFILENKWNYVLFHKIFNSLKTKNMLKWMQEYFNPSTPGWTDETNPTLWMWKDI